MAAISLVALTLVMSRNEDAAPMPLAAAVQVPVRSEAAAAPEPVRSEAAAAQVPVKCEPTAAPGRDPDPSPPPAVDATIDSAPAGAEVVLGGDVLGTTPFRGQIPRADRDVKLVVRLAGYVARTIAVRATERIHERVTLAPMQHAAPSKRVEADRDRSVNPFD